jgi:hypothetical protein
MNIKIEMLKSTTAMVIMGISTSFGFISAYLMDLTLGNAEQYLAIIAVMLLDGFFRVDCWDKKRGV